MHTRQVPLKHAFPELPKTHVNPNDRKKEDTLTVNGEVRLTVSPSHPYPYQYFFVCLCKLFCKELLQLWKDLCMYTFIAVIDKSVYMMKLHVKLTCLYIKLNPATEEV